MDIKILDSWLREYLDTLATPKQIAEYLSLCGPSVERINKIGNDSLYEIEVTTNRIDSASVYGIAREALAILPRFKVPAKLERIKTESASYSFVKKVPYLTAIVDPNLCPRFTAVLIKNVNIDHSPDWMVKRLEACGVRAINNVVDISNYIMLGLGQPVHTFDYDKIEGSKMILRESKRGEKITTLDAKVFDLTGGDIVIEDGGGRLIDLAGVMGGALSMVDDNTKNVLLFVQTYDPTRIRKTSMGLAQRTQAAAIFEKGIDTELVSPAILTAIDLFKTICKGNPEKEILNVYPKAYKPIKILIDNELIIKKLGIEVSKKDISTYLGSLEFESVWHGNKLEVVVPSFRTKDVLGEEDVVEEIARIYGYHNLPSQIMSGVIPNEPPQSDFAFETNIKNVLVGLGGNEIYTLSLVPKEFVGEKALGLKNPLGVDSEFLRTSLMPSLLSAAKTNIGTFENFHLFEMSNVYIPRKNDLPEERMTLAGILYGHSYRNSKGVIEALLSKLNINAKFTAEDINGFSASHSVTIKVDGNDIGFMGITNDKLIYYEFSVSKLMSSIKPLKFQEIPKYPAQIEDITFTLPDKTLIGDVINEIYKVQSTIYKVELKDTYNDACTFRVEYLDPNKTLTNADVEITRKEIIASVKNKFGGNIKE
ncbi:MAG: phenylalanine--tRNA ligase subunit beta [Candidatus Woesebacteria bacterium]|nr:MAG: phenylalanine--tRNA ligase subunit beta [Candidatus Woesebacteria bacterium]